MAKVLITESTLEDIADAIRIKANTNRTYKPSEMAAAINNLEDEEHQPAHINIAQTNNQTITVNANLFSTSEVQTEHTTSFTVNVPNSVQLNAFVIPDTGYTAGELNITNTMVGWDSTVSFSASPATEASQATLSFELEETSSGPYNTGDIITYKLTSSKVGAGTVEPVTAYCELTDDKWIFSGSSQTTGSYMVTEDDILNGDITLTFVNYETSDTLTELIIDNLEEPNGHLTVTASADEPYTFAVGENVNFNVILTNDGNLTITDVTLQSEETGDYWDWESLAPEQSVEEAAEYWPTEEDVSAGAVNIVFTAEGTSPDPDNPNVNVTNAVVTGTDTTVSQQPNILMTLNEDIDTSGTISYSVLVENTGDVDLTDVEIACEETGNQWTISSLPIDDNQTLDLADSDSNTIVVTATSGSYSTSQTFYVAIPVDVTISTGRASKEYDGTSLTSSEYSVDWPRDTTDTITVTVTGSQKEVGSSDNTFTYAIEYNDNPRKYNYNIIPIYGHLTVTAPPDPTPPTPDTPTPPTP